jgi:hypothetical protein
MPRAASLHNATAQDIQLELIRRRRFNEFDGQRIYDSLLKHRELWLGVLLTRVGYTDADNLNDLPFGSLIQLRDLPRNYWNADTLFIMTRSHKEAKKLGWIIKSKSENWVADEVQVHDNQKEIGSALGVFGIDYGLVSAWWD